jgi:hypothetical protein
MPTLRASLEQLAQSFAAAVLEAIRTVPLEDLLSEGGGTPRAPRAGSPRASPSAQPTGRRGGGRLPRRSQADIAKALDQVLALLKTKKTGLRAEQIRVALGVQSKELPRILKTGVASKKLRTKGQKRATTYSAA